MNYTKPWLLVAASLIFCQQAFAKGIFVHPRVGVGVSNFYRGNLTGGSLGTYRSKISFTAGVNAGYNFGGVRLGTGLHLLNTGYGVNDISYLPFNPTTGQPLANPEIFDVTIRYKQLYIPVAVGYNFKPNNKLSLIPEISTGPSILLSSVSKTKSQTTGDMTPGKGPGGHVSLYSTVALQAGYHLNNHIALTAGVGYWHELTGIFSSTPYGVRTAFYSVMGNLGLMLEL